MTDGYRFHETEIIAPNEKAAAAEARRQRLAEPDQETIEWIYLRNKNGRWVARRVLRDPSASVRDDPESKSTWQRVADFVVDLITYQP